MDGIRYLVFSGGSVRGIMFIGALKALGTRFLENIRGYAGSSVGSIIAYMLCLGYSPDEILDEMLRAQQSSMHKVDIRNLIEKFGLDSGARYVQEFERITYQKIHIHNPTFEELFVKTGRDLYITGTCLEDQCTVYFNHTTTPGMSVIKALRISMSMPFFFTHVEHEGKHYIDGATLHSIPDIRDKFPPRETLVMSVREGRDEFNPSNMVQYLHYIIQMMRPNPPLRHFPFTICLACHVDEMTPYYIKPESAYHLAQLGHDSMQEYMEQVKKNQHSIVLQ